MIGCGHVGLVLAAGLADMGHRVIGVDVSERSSPSCARACSGSRNLGLTELVTEGVASGALALHDQLRVRGPQAEVIFLAVDTPQTLAGAADLRNIRAGDPLDRRILNGTKPIIVNKSTSPIGTGETIERSCASALEERHRPAAGSCRTRSSCARAGRSRTSSTRTGSSSGRVRAMTRGRWPACTTGSAATVIVTDLRTAEMIKYVANSFLATRISFINEIARLCEAVGVGIDQVVEGIAHDPRIGDQFFRPGIGFGGSCLPKDVAALRYIGETYGVATPVLAGVQDVDSRAADERRPSPPGATREPREPTDRRSGD